MGTNANMERATTLLSGPVIADVPDSLLRITFSDPKKVDTFVYSQRRSFRETYQKTPPPVLMNSIT